MPPPTARIFLVTSSGAAGETAGEFRRFVRQELPANPREPKPPLPRRARCYQRRRGAEPPLSPKRRMMLPAEERSSVYIACKEPVP